jgi:hypothetical protein
MTDETAGRQIIVLDFGKQRAKRIKRLRKGRGRLMEDVKAAVQEVEEAGTIPAGSPVVVVVVKQRPQRGLFGRW